MTTKRLLRLKQTLREKGLDAYIATKTADIRWLTGFSGVFDEEQAHLALIPAVDSVGGKPAYLFSDKRYSQALRRADRDDCWWISDENRPRFELVVEALRQTGHKTHGDRGLRLGIESDLPLDRYRALGKALESTEGAGLAETNLVEISGIVGKLRAVKDNHEIERLKAAQAITDAAFEFMLEYLRAGMTEKQAACELEFFMRKAGADSISFPSIVASGANSAIPHAKPGARMLASGDFVLMDFGACLDDYRADMTRTVVLGAASEQQRSMYDAVLAAHLAVARSLRAGMKGLEAQGIAEEMIAEHGFAGKMIHSLGHGVGIDVHELPALAPKVEAELVVGNVVTVEPGVYIEGVGGVRIEDFGYIGEEGFVSFTSSTKDLIELG